MMQFYKIILQLFLDFFSLSVTEPKVPKRTTADFSHKILLRPIKCRFGCSGLIRHSALFSCTGMFVK